MVLNTSVLRNKTSLNLDGVTYMGELSLGINNLNFLFSLDAKCKKY